MCEKVQKKMRNFARRYPAQQRSTGRRIVTSFMSATLGVGNPFVFLLEIDSTVKAERTSRIHRFYSCLEAAKILEFTLVTFMCCLFDTLLWTLQQLSTIRNCHVLVSSSRVQTFFTDISALEDVTTRLSPKVGVVPHPKKKRPRPHRYESLKVRVWLHQLEWTHSRQGFWCDGG